MSFSYTGTYRKKKNTSPADEFLMYRYSEKMYKFYSPKYCSKSNGKIKKKNLTL